MWLILFGYHQEAMFVSMNQIARPNRTTKHFDFHSPADGPPKRVTNAKSPGNGFKTRIGHFVNITNGSVSNGAYAAQSAVDVGIYLTPN